MRRLASIVKTTSIALITGLGIFVGTPNPAPAVMLTGQVLPPTWAFGSPQRPFINGCSDVDPRRCFGHFGLGGLSDVLDYRNVGQAITTEISFAEGAAPPPAAFVFGRRETAYERNGDWWNLTIPTARWLGLGPNGGIVYYMRDPDDGIFFGDAIAFGNIGGAAHILVASNNSDTPDPTLPPDFTAMVSSFFDVFFDIPDGTFNQDTLNNAFPLPTGEQCTPGVDGCVGVDVLAALPSFIPEPSSLAILGAALAGAGLARRRRRLA